MGPLGASVGFLAPLAMCLHAALSLITEVSIILLACVGGKDSLRVQQQVMYDSGTMPVRGGLFSVYQLPGYTGTVTMPTMTSRPACATMLGPRARGQGSQGGLPCPSAYPCFHLAPKPRYGTWRTRQGSPSNFCQWPLSCSDCIRELFCCVRSATSCSCCRCPSRPPMRTNTSTASQRWDLSLRSGYMYWVVRC